MLTPSMRLCVCPLITSGGSTPRESRIDGTMSIAWWYWRRISPRPAVTFGQETMHGSEVPPLNSYRFHILNGVLNAIAAPVGVVVVGLGPTEFVEHREVRFQVVRHAVEEPV